MVLGGQGLSEADNLEPDVFAGVLCLLFCSLGSRSCSGYVEANSIGASNSG